MIESLLRCHSFIGMGPIHVAARHGSDRALEQLFVQGARANVSCSECELGCP